ncbi:DeoR family fructose operon transcriptional repressor [Deinococcus metalli]|uniref:DeoR family fructose operon transcriptional repressor n=1 Tax=Deinococcus metalli TaxID=1141878 RepID=A0A7W8KCF7_9DEIO|nr:DeoR/GlpR family DNA-binding transcription regulator [Deinococcus metalli]MBB5375642.1 DeoR family fructose operon transcriptional repressor [Deinococcus metalli]GHF38146.1 DeoR family transcriptional regulator [Deinococcus metalli]
MQSDRINKIQHHLYSNGFARVEELADATGASIVTIRRDLQRLEENGIVTRTHGGARLADGAGPEIAFQARAQDHVEAKRAIGEVAFGLLRPHTTVFLDAGTTVLQLARRLRLEPLPLTVFTNGLAVAQELVNVENVSVNLLGGQLRNENLSMVGPYAEQMLGELWFDQLYLGTSAVRDDARMYTLNPAEASLNRVMIGRTSQPIVLADSSKFGDSAPYAVAPVTAAHTLITDSRLDAAWKTRLAELNVAATVVPLGRTS